MWIESGFSLEWIGLAVLTVFLPDIQHDRNFT
jgi:hypothetical protein